ncbi:unnamed protein product [Cercopithifilaria johnstoni]|uniref:Ground-like domain-containing protein n=1 Tax=Cercopithifilaria johnstoni TaxID=2874296 RepID=A0A8J2LZ08_9BILA|nr:unnamed protein product [Cercopithifilaria johnstoni]
MIEIVHRFGIIFIVTLYVTVNIYTVEGSPCRCTPCKILCAKLIQCPPPVTCPIQTCPAPPPCPQPPPCPPCPHSQFSCILQNSVVTRQIVVPVVRKKRQLKMDDEMNNNKLSLNPICNNKILQKIMDENIMASDAESQRLIQNASETQLGGHFNVLCSNNDLSYSAFATSLFCQHQKNNIICLAFKTP